MSRSASFRRIGVASCLVMALALGGCGVIGGKGKVKTTPTTGERVPVLSRIEAGTKVDTEMSAVAVVLPPPVVNTEWAEPGGAASKSYGHLALGDAPHKIWTASVAGSSPRERLAAAPVIGGGQLFVYDTAGMVHAFDADTGRQNWKVSLKGKKNSGSLFGGGVSFADNRVFVDTGLGEVAALDAADGKQIWKVKPAGPLRGSPTVAFDAVYVMTQDNQIFALNVADGAGLWNESGSTGQTGVFGVAAPAAAQGTVIAGYSSGELVAYRYENGRQLWSDALSRTSIATSVSTLTDIDADPIIENGKVYALGQGGRMAAYELVTGQRIWELSLAGISTPAVAGDWIFTLTDEAKLLCIAKASGKVRWLTQMKHYGNVKKKTSPVFWTGPVLAGNRLIVASSRGELMAVSAADGSATPLAKLGKPITLAPVVANSTLYVLDDGGKITAFR
ncbi:outer membrane protein assembly factor BamB family protein [Novosphingobium lentum]|uniref:outer membrane protein assembly factor BamB family protein n=1 Tax=Novosphingobium lentum TaxID=145287 RepID=UPI000836C689|nr:PQQ-binding-like beta-propeller repeat protein [Novosphingobium lentum]